jgi:hypothetical protein
MWHGKAIKPDPQGGREKTDSACSKDYRMNKGFTSSALSICLGAEYAKLIFSPLLGGGYLLGLEN